MTFAKTYRTGAGRVAAIVGLLAAVGILAAGPRAHAGQTSPPPDVEALLNEYFAEVGGAGATEVLAWTEPPDDVALADPRADLFPTSPGTPAAFQPPAADLTGVAMAFTAPFDAATLEALFGKGGALAKGAPNVHYPGRYDIDVDKFADGMLVTALVPGAPRAAAPDSFIAAVEAFDPRYPNPTGTVFEGINKSWRFSVTPEGTDVDYRQFDGRAFRAFQTETVVLDTCGPGGGGGCEYVFFTAASGVELKGNQRALVELFEQDGTQAAADRIGAGRGVAIPWADIGRGAIGLQPVQPVGGAPVAAAPAVGTSTDGGIPFGPVVLVGTGAAAVLGGWVLVRRNRGTSVLTYTDDATVATVPRDDDAVRDQWRLLLYNEEQIQARLLEDYRRVAGQFAQGLQTIGGAMATYERGFQDVAWQANWLAGVAAENKTALKVTTGIDLVLGVVDAAPSIYYLGKAGWTTLFGAGDEAVEVASDVVGATTRGTAYGSAETAIAAARLAESPELASILAIAQREGDGLDAVFTEACVLADRAGIDFAKVAPGRFDEVMLAYHNHAKTAIEAVWVDMAEAAAKAKGFVKASNETAELITTVTINLRSYCNGGVVGSLADLRVAADGLTGLAAKPGFFDTVPNLYTVVGGPGSADTAIELLQHGDDIAFMKWVTQQIADGHALEELPGLYQQMRGPVALAGQDIAQQLSVGLGANTLYSTTQGINTGLQLYQLFDGPMTVSSVFPDGVTYLSQYGILRPTFLGMEAGDSAPWTIAFNALNSAGGFSTWLTGFRASIEGGLLYDEARVELQPTFQSMAGASLDLVNALQVIGERVSTDSISNDDRRALEGVLSDMTACVTGAGPDLRAELGPVLEERSRHITAKLAQLESVQGAIVMAAQQLPNIASTLDGMVSVGRDSVQWADPALREGFVVATGVVNALGGGVLQPPGLFGSK